MATSRTIALGAGGGAMTLLGTATVAGAAATTLTLSGLDLSLYKAFEITGSLDNATASQSIISCFFNADTTATNYDNENSRFNGATITAGRSNANSFAVLEASSECVFWGKILNDANGKPSAFASQRSLQTTTLETRFLCCMWRTAANVTSITLSGSVASSLAIGSTFSVWGIV